MKRYVWPLALALALVAAAFYLLHRAPHVPRVAEWLPGSTVFFEEAPDIRRTKDRWPQTDIAQLINEPEVQAFLARPLGNLPFRDELNKRMGQLGQIDPSRFFLAATDWSQGAAPKVVAGLCYTGSKDALDEWVSEARNAARTEWPDAKSDVQAYGSGNIETFTAPDFTVALAYRGKWLFLSTDTDLLKSTLDAFQGKQDPNCLEQLPAYKECLEHLPTAPDNVLFLRPGLLADKVASLEMMLNPTGEMQEPGKLKDVDAMAMALKLDGENMRDAVYAIKSQPGDATPLARDVLKLSTADTILAIGGRAGGEGENVQLPDTLDTASDPTGILRTIQSFLKAFEDQGLGSAQFGQAFGPEGGFLINWPSGAVEPAPLVMLDVRDPAEARKFLDTLMTLPIGSGAGFARQEQGGVAYYSLPPSPMGTLLSLQLTMALTDKFAVAATSMDGAKEAVSRWEAGRPGLAATADYQRATGWVPQPTNSFTYVDTKALFERLYGPLQALGGFASMGLVPHLSDYIDMSKLPKAETIERHLGPVAASESAKDGGILTTSAGPVTITQGSAVVVAVIAAVALEEIQGQFGIQSLMGNGGQNPSVNPFGSGGFAIPSVPVPTPAPGIPAASASPSAGSP